VAYGLSDHSIIGMEIHNCFSDHRAHWKIERASPSNEQYSFDGLPEPVVPQRTITPFNLIIKKNMNLH